ncbi:MAG: hypothetical protein A2X88_05725 [Deltaproteobacteria bacterium GWC2_65_14]|nr:MAG: hypothetical protein A2X88_05725 [Deltaproteobacteria bacterium GWC2_65_14]
MPKRTQSSVLSVTVPAVVWILPHDQELAARERAPEDREIELVAQVVRRVDDEAVIHEREAVVRRLVEVELHLVLSDFGEAQVAIDRTARGECEKEHQRQQASDPQRAANGSMHRARR